MKRLRRKLLFSRAHRTFIHWARRIVPPGFDGFSLYAIGRFFFQALDQGKVETRASAISFKVFIAFFPVLIGTIAGLQAAPAALIEDRAAAIAHAVGRAAPQDVVLVAGKGHEDYQEIAGQKLPFSDVAHARAALAARKEAA